MIWYLARHEWRGLFRTSLGWALLALAQIGLGTSTYVLLSNYQQKLQLLQVTRGVSYEVAGLLIGLCVYLCLFLVPMVAVALIANERRQCTWPLLFTSPVSLWEIILGKYFGLLMYIALIEFSLLICLVPVAYASALDYGLVTAALLGAFLLMASFGAIALFIACLTTHTVLALFGSMGVLLAFILLELFANTRIVWVDGLLAQLSPIQHLHGFLEGLVNFTDLLYFVTLIVLFLVLSVLRITRRRLL